MKAKINNSNIYNKNGVLLIAKGQLLTTELLLKLQELNNCTSIGELNKNDIILTQCQNNIKAGLLQVDSGIIKQSNELVRNIIFESKNSQWWMSLNLLSNYSDWIYAHSIDVALISMIIAIQLNYSKTEQKDICIGALFHDIGKLLIPKSILEKESPLTDYESMIFQQHCELGSGIIKDFNLSEGCTNIVLEHHERLDGSGYPHQLKDEQLSDYAKIVMVADTFDAVTSFQPSKRIETVGFALEEFKADDGKYDQSIVDTLYGR